MTKTNNNIFLNLAPYYDAIYQNKNYDGEVKAIKKILKKELKNKTKNVELLDLGCGTAEHCLRFAKLGYKVLGVDRSAEVIKLAKKKQVKNKNKIKFINNDILKIELKKKFDVITCLFHVTSYLTKNDELKKFFSVVKNHLKDDGVFIFDFWYGPGVVADKPTTIYKDYVSKNHIIHRIKVPSLLEKNNLVKVKHIFFIEEKRSKKIISHFNEEHTLRYLFPEEVMGYLKEINLEVVKWGKIDNDFEPTASTDYETCFIVKNKNS